MANQTDEARLLDELRGDTELDGEQELDALSRVERRLMLRVIEGGAGDAGDMPSPARRLPAARWWHGARGGMVAALLVGTALGAGGHAVASFVVSSLQPAEPKREREPATKVAPAAPHQPRQPAVSTSTESAAPLADTVELGAAPPSSPKAAAQSSGRQSLELELSELEVARRAVSQGEGSSALRMLARHAQRYPGSVLAQEREALTIKALVLTGRHDEARKLAVSFEARHPNSMLLDAVERSLGAIP